MPTIPIRTNFPPKNSPPTPTLGGPFPPIDLQIFAKFGFASRRAVTSQHWPSRFLLLPNLQTAVIVVKKMEGNACPILIGEIGFRAMRHAVTKKHNSACFQFDGDSTVFRWIASDVMVAERISVVMVGFSVAAGDYVKTSVFNVRVMNCNPHRGAAQRVGNLEVGVVLMPVCTDSHLGRFPKGLIQFQHEIVPDELLHDG